MNKNDFLVIDPCGNVALITADEYARMAAEVKPHYNIMYRTHGDRRVFNITEAKKCVDAYLRAQWGKATKVGKGL